MSMDYSYKFFGYSISYAVLYIHMAILYLPILYFLIPSALHSFPDPPCSSDNHQNALHIHDSISVLVCLVCFLDSIVDRYVFLAIFVHSFDLLLLLLFNLNIFIDYAITVVPFPPHSTPSCPCLLYTSDAADDTCVV